MQFSYAEPKLGCLSLSNFPWSNYPATIPWRNGAVFGNCMSLCLYVCVCVPPYLMCSWYQWSPSYCYCGSWATPCLNFWGSVAFQLVYPGPKIAVPISSLSSNWHDLNQLVVWPFSFELLLGHLFVSSMYLRAHSASGFGRGGCSCLRIFI